MLEVGAFPPSKVSSLKSSIGGCQDIFAETAARFPSLFITLDRIFNMGKIALAGGNSNTSGTELKHFWQTIHFPPFTHS